MKYNLKAIMKRAWVIKKKNRRNIFRLCLKMSWCEYKQMLKDKLVNEMLNKFCSKVRPKWYRKNMSTKAMIGILEKNNVEIPDDIRELI